MSASACASESSKVRDPPSLEAMSRNQKRQEKRKQRLQDMQHLVYTEHYSNCRLPALLPSPSDEQLLQLECFGALAAPSSERRTSSSKSPWDQLRLVPCPFQGCHCSLDPSGLLGHYLNDHLRALDIPFVELVTGKRVSLSFHISSLDTDVHTLLGVYGYRRTGLNPLKCPRNTHLPAEYRQFSQHGVLLVFACRTQHSMLWQTKRGGIKHDALAIWVCTPLQDVAISLRLLVQPANLERYYTKLVQARPIQPESGKQSCKEFIRNNNVIVISFEDLRPLMDLDVPQQVLTVELRVIGAAKI